MSSTSDSKKILVIEDEEMVRELTVLVLTRAGYRVSAAGDGEVAWQLFESDPNAFDLLFIDVQIPRLGGFEFGRRAQAIRPRLPILFTSGVGFNQIGTENILAAEIAFLAKPFTPDLLLAMVRTLLDQDREAAAGQ